MSRALGARLGLVGAAVALLGACHTYRTVESPQVGSVVRVRVPVTSALNNPNAAPETASIEGLLVSTGDTMTLATETRREFGAYREIVQRDTLRLALTQTSSIEVREFSTGRSVLLGSTIAAIAGTAAAVAFGFGGGGDPPGGNGNGPVTSIVASPAIVSALLGLFGR